MKQIALLFLLTLSLGCEDRNSKTKLNPESDTNTPPAYVSIDTSNGKQFRVVIQEGKTITPISESEIYFIDSLLQQKIDQHNRKVDKRFSMDLLKYGRQYFPSLDTNGNKEVEVICFCQVNNNDDWKKHRIQVNDGGNCYFNFKINLTTLRILHFYVNGQG